jgi:NAD(P)-dependent dehydrogenase (short-subunit alcohol dehydrogenase family)
MSTRLAGSTALVTGSTLGIGRTIADWLAREGARIVVTGEDPRAVDGTVGQLGAAGHEALGCVADLSRVDEAHRLADEVLRRVEHLDILINNAGMSRRAAFWDVSDEDWDYQVNVNYRAPFILCQHIARHMLARGVRGRMVNIGTIGAHGCHKDAAVYDSAKGAVEVMTRNMAYELAPHGVRVNCVIPGWIAERPGSPWRATDAPGRDHIPVGRAGRAEDIAAAVLFFCLPETDFTTGQSLLVDGGHHAYLPEG